MARLGVEAELMPMVAWALFQSNEEQVEAMAKWLGDFAGQEVQLAGLQAPEVEWLLARASDRAHIASWFQTLRAEELQAEEEEEDADNF